MADGTLPGAERQISQFIRALRSAEVRVSTAEALDAARAVALIGYGSRTLLKDTLACVLAKSEAEKATHDRLFDLFFATAPLAVDAAGLADDTLPTQDEAGALDELALPENGAALAAAIERAAEATGLDQIRFSTQVAYYSQAMLKAMGGGALEAKLVSALKAGGAEADAEAQRLIDARRSLMMAARARAERAFNVYGAGETDLFRDEFIASKRLSALEMHEMARMKRLIAKLARRLAVKHSRRQRRTSRGQLDIRRTLRANAALGGVPFHVVWRQKKRDRPKVFVICDVSGSVAPYVRFLLLLLYAMREAIPDLRAFAFSFRLIDVSAMLDSPDFDAAMKRILREAGMGSTSYGQAFADFACDHAHALDRRTTLLILGDGRNNYGDPRLDLFRNFAGRVKRVVWLNPEGPALWGTGDSVIHRYRPFCAQMTHVATLKQLIRAVDEMLAAYG